MLQHLHIQNYALIDHLDIDFLSGFSVITGETGAGKSILLGALNLLLGQRADSRSIKTGEQRCVVEATFSLQGYGLDDFFQENELDFEDEECIIRRELTAAGKSRAFINDTPATLAQLKELGDKLIDIHSQHQNLLLSKENFQLQVVDIMAKHQPLVDDYAALYHQMRQTEDKLQEAREQANADRSELDYMQFQFDQLEEAHLQAGEQEELEQEQQTLEHAEEIKTTLFNADHLLENDEAGLLNTLREANRMLASIEGVFPLASELAERIESARIELKDVATELASEADNIDCDQERLQEVGDRLSLIYDLEQKHHADSIEALLEIQASLEQRLSVINGSDEQIEQLEKQLKEEQNLLRQKAAVLTTQRQQAAEEIEQEMCSRLVPLGMPNVQMKVAITPLSDFSASGLDKITFLFSANKNATLQPISQVASGGEMARVMLTLKALISNAVQLPTIIFDEIDTGVSGHIAECMAHIMQEMGATGHRQVISITHLPQIAALGTTHYRVYKEDSEEGTTSHITQLSKEERIEELAHMLSGANLTQAAIDNAKALLKN